ncbi:hypothetical protein Pr1d_06080 [Bythopirellula goksoeyrii]|uniref:Uncharacterized protein n=1 Tax=Bythopirellula goksoeyrii TaxID=1400387 RepID=A0A5B9Q2U5_9BACT|nr:hypothetical protein Pr1d_06080 [Bythopirellula goksoeyrii]
MSTGLGRFVFPSQTRLQLWLVATIKPWNLSSSPRKQPLDFLAQEFAAAVDRGDPTITSQ